MPTPEPSTPEPMICFEQVHKWFGALHVLDDINLRVMSGEVVVVCGPSGSGKSTLVRAVNRLEPIQQGRLVVDGQDLSSRTTDINRLRAEVGFVFQHFNLYPHLSVVQNICLAPMKVRGTGRDEAEQQAQALLQRVGLRISAMPIRANFQAGSSSGWRLRGHWPCAPRYCCSMSRPPRSIRK